MDTKRRMKLARRVAGRCLVASSGTELSSVIQNGSSRARLAVDQLEDAIERGIALINESEHKEAIYAEAGDLIQSVTDLLAQTQEGLAIVSYAVAKLDEKKLRNRIPAHVRDQVDQAVKKDT